MMHSQLFPKTLKEASRDAVAANHKLLVRGGFMDQLMAGSWTLLPLGWRVVGKINNIIRAEMNATGGQELALPLLHSKEIWNETGRWESAADIMYTLKDSREREYALSFTHEEIIMDLIRKHVSSYKDLPIKIYQFSTKFRQELRATGGILRGREFLMKDMYSAHESEEDLMAYYEEVKQAYLKIFARLGLEVIVTEASGGVFTDKHTHEFQVLAESGEDTIYYCSECKQGQNKEVLSVAEGDKCPWCSLGKVVVGKSIEVGNIFPLGTKYATDMKAFFTDKNGKQQPFWFGSYGIGPTRVLGTLVEVHHDEKGILWPKEVAPFAAHLVGLKDAGEVYEELQSAGIEVLYDDSDRSAGEKFADADLLGIPVRLVVSAKTGDKIEWKDRNSDETRLMTRPEVVSALSTI